MSVVARMRALNSSVPFAALVTTTIAWAGPDRICGHAHVLDGDIIIVDGWRVRLKRVDAPELGAPSGSNAHDVMRDIVGPEGILVCELTGERTRGSEVGFCARPDSLDVNREIIARGAALTCPRFSELFLSIPPDATRPGVLQH
jgi:endonuclease YncB( thermonuclease family)